MQETLDKLGQVTKEANLGHVLRVSCADVHLSVGLQLSQVLLHSMTAEATVAANVRDSGVHSEQPGQPASYKQRQVLALQQTNTRAVVCM